MPRGDVQANSQFMIPTLQELLPDNLALAPLPVRVYSIAQAIHALMPDRFYLLEGFSREEGGVIFFSRDSRKIYNSGTGLHALPLGDSGWFVNTAISQNEAPVFFERIARTMVLPISVKLHILSLIKAYDPKKRADLVMR